MPAPSPSAFAPAPAVFYDRISCWTAPWPPDYPRPSHRSGDIFCCPPVYCLPVSAYSSPEYPAEGLTSWNRRLSLQTCHRKNPGPDHCTRQPHRNWYPHSPHGISGNHTGYFEPLRCIHESNPEFHRILLHCPAAGPTPALSWQIPDWLPGLPWGTSPP